MEKPPSPNLEQVLAVLTDTDREVINAWARKDFFSEYQPRSSPALEKVISQIEMDVYSNGAAYVRDMIEKTFQCEKL